MKKFLIILVVSLTAIPVSAVCSIENEGLCRADIMNQETLNERLVPNHLEDIQKPPSLPIDTAPSDIRYNLESQELQNSGTVQNEPYNANCQFGTCLGEPE